MTGVSHASTIKSARTSLFMPEESEPHKRTWMAFVANDYIWPRRQIPDRIIEQIATDGIASGSSIILCATQQEIAD